MEPTQGAQDEKYVKANTGDPAIPTQTGDNKGNLGTQSVWGKTVTDAGDVVIRLSEKPDFAALLVSVIGYIVISSFGGLKTFGELVMYIIFLFFAFLIYKLLNSSFDLMEVEIRNKYYVIAILILLMLLIGSNLDRLNDIYNLISQFLSKNISKPRP